jgi:hypothetical protein
MPSQVGRMLSGLPSACLSSTCMGLAQRGIKRDGCCFAPTTHTHTLHAPLWLIFRAYWPVPPHGCLQSPLTSAHSGLWPHAVLGTAVNARSSDVNIDVKPADSDMNAIWYRREVLNATGIAARAAWATRTDTKGGTAPDGGACTGTEAVQVSRQGDRLVLSELGGSSAASHPQFNALDSSGCSDGSNNGHNTGRSPTGLGYCRHCCQPHCSSPATVSGVPCPQVPIQAIYTMYACP